jgi:hypothetical protein
MLVEGDLDALIHPELIQPILNKDRRVTRLFPAYRELEIDYFRRTGIFPIMHTTAIKQEVVEKYPWVPINLMQAFEKSKKAAYKRMENPRIVPLAWFRHFLEEQDEILGADPWVYGLGDNNRKNLETKDCSVEKWLWTSYSSTRRGIRNHGNSHRCRSGTRTRFIGWPVAIQNGDLLAPRRHERQVRKFYFFAAFALCARYSEFWLRLRRCRQVVSNQFAD